MGILLLELKDELSITWDYEDPKLLRHLKSGKSKINKLVGSNINFEENEEAKTLLFNYCRYSRSNSLEFFNINYQSDIIALQLEEGVKSLCEE